MTARDDILKRVRQGVGKGDFAQRRAAAEAQLKARAWGPQPVLPADLVARFADKAQSLSSTVGSAPTMVDAPQAIADWLRAAELPSALVASPNLANLPWAAAGLSVACRAAQDADQVGVTGCFCAIAETGTLLLLSGPETPATVSLLPETHIALLPVERIVPTMEAAFALMRAERGEQLPRAVNFVSGPSRTGDIEQTIVLGAHGPCRVHIILIGATA